MCVTVGCGYGQPTVKRYRDHPGSGLPHPGSGSSPFWLSLGTTGSWSSDTNNHFLKHRCYKRTMEWATGPPHPHDHIEMKTFTWYKGICTKYQWRWATGSLHAPYTLTIDIHEVLLEHCCYKLVLMFPLMQIFTTYDSCCYKSVCTLHVTGSYSTQYPLGTNIHSLLQERWGGQEDQWSSWSSWPWRYKYSLLVHIFMCSYKNNGAEEDPWIGQGDSGPCDHGDTNIHCKFIFTRAHTPCTNARVNWQLDLDTNILSVQIFICCYKNNGVEGIHWVRLSGQGDPWSLWPWRYKYSQASLLLQEHMHGLGTNWVSN